MLNRLRLRLRAIARRGRLEREMQDEMTAHLEQSAARLTSRGLSVAEARSEARREFGNVGFLQEEARDARGSGWVDALAADCRFAVRHFGRRLSTTLIMLIVLIGGMSISTLLFTFVRAYANQPPRGVQLADDLVRIRGNRSAGSAERVWRALSESELGEYRKLTNHFSGVAGWTDALVTIGLPGSAERRGIEARVSFVVGNYFAILGVRPLLGPGLSESDDVASNPVAVIGHSAWERLFAGSDDAAGATVLVNGVPITVVGVTPQKFVGLPSYDGVQLYMPLSARRLVMNASGGSFTAIARLEPGVSHLTATAAVEAVAARTAEAAGPEATVLDPSADVVPLLGSNDGPGFEDDVRRLWASVGVLGVLVLLVACTNVSGLLTGLATARQHEIAIRLSLGAARGRIVRQLLTESTLLAVIAAVGALGVVWLVLQTVPLIDGELPFEIVLAWQETAFIFAVALVVGATFGLSPALHATRLGVANALRDAADTIAAGRGRLQRGLVVAQITLTQPLIVLLVTVLLFVIDQAKPQPRNDLADRLVGISARNLAGVDPQSADSGATDRVRATVRRLAETFVRAPGIEGAYINWRSRPMSGAYVVHPADRAAGPAPEPVQLSGMPADHSHFDVMAIRLIRGRTFAKSDVSPPESKPASVPAVIGIGLARRMWGDVDPIGRRLEAATDSTTGPRTLVVIGVVDDSTKKRSARDAYRVFVPPDTTLAPASIVVRTAAMGRSHVAAVRETVQDVAPQMSFSVRVLGDIADAYARRYWVITAGVSAAGLASLLLSAIGLYAVVALAVGQRRREIAVRMAIGARGGQVVQRFVFGGLRLSVFGLALGLPLSVFGAGVLMGMLDDEFPRVALGPVTTIATIAVLVVALVAAWLPARRASAIDPADALRST